MKPVSVYPTNLVEDTLLLDVRMVADLLTVSVRSVERLVAAGEFVPAIRLNARTVRWSRVAVEEWIARRVAAAAVDAG